MSNPLDDLSPDIRDRLLNYQPKLLDASDAAAVLPGLRDLVASAQPTSSDFARQYMSTVCRFLADSSEGRTCSLDLLVDLEVARWASRAEAGGMKDKTLQGHIGRLKALLRVRQGLPAQLAVKGKAPVHEPPYSASEAAVILEAVSELGAGPLAVAVALLGAGVMPKEAEGGRLRYDDEGLMFVTGAGAERPVLTEVAAQADEASVSASVVGGDDFKAAQSAAAGAGIVFGMHRGLQTYRVAVLRDGRPVGAALAEFPLGEKALDAARPFLAAVDAEAVAAMLRG